MAGTPAVATFALALSAVLAEPAAAQTEIRALTEPRGVEIAGSVTRVFGNRFVLEDATGAVLVETGPSWYHRIEMTMGEQVRVRGEPDGDGFDAFVITRANGEALRIRPEDGPPPWAGGRRD